MGPRAKGVEREVREPCDNVCETADAPESLKSDVWTHCGFPESRNKRRKGEGLTESNMQTPEPIHAFYTLLHILYRSKLIHGLSTSFCTVFSFLLVLNIGIIVLVSKILLSRAIT